MRGFARRDIADRYDVATFKEDAWHSHADAERARLIKANLPRKAVATTYGRAADIATVEYNGGPERVWAYDPTYIKTLVRQNGLIIVSETHIMGWAAALERIGARIKAALLADAMINRLTRSAILGDLTFICARRNEIERSQQ